MTGKRISTLALVIGMGLCAGSAVAGDHKCAGTVAAELATHGISQANVQTINYVADKSGSVTNNGYFAWVRLKDKPGSLVVGLKTNCGSGDLSGTA